MATTESMETGVGEVNGDDRGTEEESMDVDGEVEEPQEQTKSSEEMAEMKKVEGNKLYGQRDYEGALRLYTEAIELQPKQARYYGNRSAALMMLSRYAAALDDARMTVKLDEKFVKGYYRCGKCHLAMGSVRNAITCFQKVIEKDPKNKDAHTDIWIYGRYLLARNMNTHNQKHFSDFIYKIQDIKLKTAKMVQEFENSAFDAYEKQDFRKVVFCMNRIMDTCPDCSTYKVMKAEALALQGKYGEAQIEANDILRTDTGNSDAIYVRGLCLYYQDNVEKAYEHFSRVLRKDPDHKKARIVYKKAKSLHSTKASGNEAFSSGRYQDAHTTYSEALEIDPLNKYTNAKIYYNRALVDAKLKKMDNAIEDCTKAIELDSSYLKAYLKRAKCYMETEQYEEAVRDYEKIVKMDKSREYRQLLQEAKLELKKSKRKDYYKILGVPKTATEDEIKKGYRKEALKHHPDRHSSATEEERKTEEKLFKEVNEAYSILSDPKKRHRYDSGQDLDDMGFGGGDFDPDQIFQQFFGGAGPGFMFNMGGMGGQQGGGGFPGGFKFTFG